MATEEMHTNSMPRLPTKFHLQGRELWIVWLDGVEIEAIHRGTPAGEGIVDRVAGMRGNAYEYHGETGVHRQGRELCIVWLVQEEMHVNTARGYQTGSTGRGGNCGSCGWTERKCL